MLASLGGPPDLYFTTENSEIICMRVRSFRPKVGGALALFFTLFLTTNFTVADEGVYDEKPPTMIVPGTTKYALVTKNKKSSAVSASGLSTKDSSKVIEPPVSEIAQFLKVVTQKRIKCQHKKTIKAVGICSEMKVLIQLELLAKAYISIHKRSEALTTSLSYYQQEDAGLRNELKAERSPASLEKYDGCFKKDLLKKLLIDYGVNSNGSNLFSKKPVGENGVCWTNSKKKREATISICDYPLAVFIKTKGGEEKDPILQDKQYLFSLNSCDLVAVHTQDQSRKGPKETFLTYDACRTQWNKRTADAAMDTTQVRLMEDTIGACFREFLLPPRSEKGGRSNPNLPPPPQAKIPVVADPDHTGL